MKNTTANTTVQVFENDDFGKIRVGVQDSGNLFCLTDLCKAVGISNSRNVVKRLDERDVYQMDTPTKNQHGTTVMQSMTYVTESGMYEIIIRSDSPKAKQFRRWVTSEVLPSLRKKGAYMVTTQEDTPETIMARALLLARETIDNLENRLEVAKPKVRYYNTVIESRDLYSTYQLAGELDMAYPTLRKRLVEKGVVSSTCGKMSVNDDFEDWVVYERLPGRRSKCIRWTKLGREGVFRLINPQLPC